MNIEEHKENLKKYIEEDFAFRESIKNMNDFDKYCYNHCQDIKEVLNELDKKDKVIDMIANELRDTCHFEYMSRKEVKEYFYNKIEIPEEN